MQPKQDNQSVPENSSAEEAAPVEEKTTVEDMTPYAIVSVPIDAPPIVKKVIGAKKFAKAVRASYNSCDQQYMFAIKGQIGELILSRNILHIVFDDETDDIRVPLTTKPRVIENGWMGDDGARS